MSQYGMTPASDDAHRGEPGPGSHPSWYPAPPGDFGPGGQVPAYGPRPPHGTWQHVPPGHLMQVQRPGVIPLRPLGMGEIFDGAFKTMRRNPAATIGLGLLVSAAFMIPSLLVSAWLTRTTWLAAEDMALLVTYLPSLFGALSTVLLSGFIVYVVSEAALGQKVSIGRTWQHVRGRLLPLLGFVLLTTAAAVLLVGLLVLLAWGTEGATLVLVIVLGLVGTVLVTVWLSVRLSMTTPVLVLERVGVFASMGRSWRLTSGSQFWRILGISLLATILVWVIVNIATIPLAVLAGVAMVVTGGDGSALNLGMLFFSHGLELLTAALTTPFVAGVTCLLYLDQRIRREALDVTLMQVARERHERHPRPHR